MGLPTSLSGREGAAAAGAREFAADLAGRLAPVPVRLVDERFTTTEAHGALRRGGKDARARRQVVDAAAAAVLLQAALDTERATGRPAGQLVRAGDGAAVAAQAAVSQDGGGWPQDPRPPQNPRPPRHSRGPQDPRSMPTPARSAGAAHGSQASARPRTSACLPSGACRRTRARRRRIRACHRGPAPAAAARASACRRRRPAHAPGPQATTWVPGIPGSPTQGAWRPDEPSHAAARRARPRAGPSGLPAPKPPSHVATRPARAGQPRSRRGRYDERRPVRRARPVLRARPVPGRGEYEDENGAGQVPPGFGDADADDDDDPALTSDEYDDGTPCRRTAETNGQPYRRQPRRRTSAAAGGGGRRRRRFRWIAPLVALLVIVVPLAVGGVYGYNLYMSKYHPADYPGTAPARSWSRSPRVTRRPASAPKLVKLGVVASSRAFVLAAEHSTSGAGLLPGFYGMHEHMKASLAYALLVNPKNMVQVKVTIPEGWRLSQIVAYLGAKSGIAASAYAKALKDPASLGLPAFANGKPEGYLFPATYEVVPHETAAGVLKGMVQRFDQEAADGEPGHGRPARAR